MRRFRIKRGFKRKESILKNRFFWLSFFILILVLGLSYLFIFSQIFRIEEIKVLNTDDSLKIKVEGVIESEIGKSIFLVNLNKISEEILGQFPEIAQLDLKRKFPRIINIQIETREPVGIWCYQSYDKCFFINKEGIIFKEIGEEPIEGKIIILLLKEGEIFVLGEEILVPQILELILEIEKELEENLKIEIEDFTIVSEKRLNIKTKENWEIYFNLEKDIELELTKLKVLLEKEIPPENRRNLEYIDLRFEKIFYK